MSLTCKIEIIVDCVTDQRAGAVRRALEPDNINFPENLTLEIENVGSKIVFNFRCTDSMKSLIATVDEVLEHAQVSLGVTE